MSVPANAPCHGVPLIGPGDDITRKSKSSAAPATHSHTRDFGGWSLLLCIGFRRQQQGRLLWPNGIVYSVSNKKRGARTDSPWAGPSGIYQDRRSNCRLAPTGESISVDELPPEFPPSVRAPDTKT